MENSLDLTRENLTSICRLCLKVPKISISIFDRVDPNPNKKPLKDRIWAMYSVKVSPNDGLPTNICHRCLYLTEMYTDFSESVRQCEIKLQNFISSASIELVSNAPIAECATNGLLPLNANDSVTVIDPSKEYQSTDDESSASDTEIFTTPLPPAKQQNAKVNRFKAQQIKNVFFCEFCDKAFVSQEECLRHQLTSHDQQNPHICTFCTFQCASRNTIIAHIKECHDLKPFLCTQCHKKFGRRSDLRKHSVVHTGIRPFSCKICSKNFSRNTNLTKHMRIHDKDQIKRDDQLASTSRNRNDAENMVISLDPFNDQDSNVDDDSHLKALPLRRNVAFNQPESIPVVLQQNYHMNPVPIPPVPPSLPPIHMSLPNPINIPAPKPSIPVPVQSIDPIEIEPEPETSISLLYKGSVPSDAVDFARHVTGDAVTFMPNKSNKEPVVKPKTFCCTSCPKKFATQSSLLNHRNIHLDIRNHVCVVCNKSFIRKRELDRHSTIHTTNRPFACNSCPKKFGRKDKLVRHEKTHLEYFCPKCHLAFNRKDAMLLHLKMHESTDNAAKDELLHANIRSQNELLNPMAFVRPRNEYEAPMNLIVTEQSSVQPKMYTPWPNLGLHDNYVPFQ
ncbi:zinc finger protein 271-like [Bradysia coprophila]|uniref:zinc finger protein 271-like n=1 Tax=Bradysia coprophila TaxID=38358 RepID=UPI00187DB9E7|nr:zinc finger protein 271-like [Bradysia coprophila]